MKGARWSMSIVVGTALVFGFQSEGGAQAPSAPVLPVLHASLSSGLAVTSDECGHAIKELHDARSSLTHVRTVGSAAAVRLETERAAPLPLTRVLLAYTLQGPRDEVAILVCGPSEPTEERK